MIYDVTCSNKICEKSKETWEVVCKLKDRDKLEKELVCEVCKSSIKFLILTAPTPLFHTEPLNKKEKGIARDLKEAYNLDRAITLGDMRHISETDKREVKKQIDKLEHSD